MTQRSSPRSPANRSWSVAGGLTMTVGLVTLLVSIAGLANPMVLAALRRQPGELGDGQLWRLLSSLLVHDSWMALVGNLVLLLLIGTAAERRLSGRRWGALYLIGGVTGQLAGLWWQPTGAGNSVAILGLLGGLAVLTLSGRAEEMIAVAFGVVVLSTLVIADLGGGALATALVACALGAVGVTVARRRLRYGAAPLPPRPTAGIALALALILVVLRDIHGAAVLSGAAATALLIRRGEGDVLLHGS